MSWINTKYDKQYWTGEDTEKTTLRAKCAEVCNTNWVYSMHWGDDTWPMDATRDIGNRIAVQIFSHMGNG